MFLLVRVRRHDDNRVRTAGRSGETPVATALPPIRAAAERPADPGPPSSGRWPRPRRGPAGLCSGRSQGTVRRGTRGATRGSTPLGFLLARLIVLLAGWAAALTTALLGSALLSTPRLSVFLVSGGLWTCAMLLD